MNNENPLVLRSNLVFDIGTYSGVFKLDTIKHEEISNIQLFSCDMGTDKFDESTFDIMCQKLKNAIFKKGE